MALQLSTGPDQSQSEVVLLDHLLGNYGDQQRLYREVLELSRRQLALVRAGAPIGEVRAVLAAKKARLDVIGRLDAGAADHRLSWRRGRSGWSAAGRARLHRALTEVGQIIEDILACEEENDRELLQQCR